MNHKILTICTLKPIKLCSVAKKIRTYNRTSLTITETTTLKIMPKNWSKIYKIIKFLKGFCETVYNSVSH